jgi:hypothetical protein
MPHHKRIETDKNDKLVPYINMGQFDQDNEPEEYKIVETIYDNDEEEDHRQKLNDELASLDKMDIYDQHLVRDTAGNIYNGRRGRSTSNQWGTRNSTKHLRYSSL